MKRDREKQIEVFWSRVDKSGECWPWKGACTRGYGRYGFEGRIWRTHCLVWVLENGPVPDGKIVRHRCDNPPCCNPAHLLVGTNQDNSRDAVERDRMARGERQHLAKLSEPKVRSIRYMSTRGYVPRQLAKIFKVAPATIRAVLKGVTWRRGETCAKKEEGATGGNR